MRKNLRATAGFSLIEIMIVISIIAIVMTTGVPSLMRALSKDELARAVHDTIEGCKTARDHAILQGIPYEFVIREDGTLNVRGLPPEQGITTGPAGAMGGTGPARTPSGPYAGFPRKLGEDVAIQLIDVNFVNHMQESEAHARFFPNGTCDEFTVVYACKGKQRTVTADIVTGEVNEMIRE
jgi:prepilin-type N-terminal cleavage/methylation domain-containing protein